MDATFVPGLDHEIGHAVTFRMLAVEHERLVDQVAAQAEIDEREEEIPVLDARAALLVKAHPTEDLGAYKSGGAQVVRFSQERYVELGKLRDPGLAAKMAELRVDP